jgi:hypothetical protein
VLPIGHISATGIPERRALMTACDSAILDVNPTGDVPASVLTGLSTLSTESIISLIRISVDPGMKGAIALLEGPDLLDVVDMPTRTELGEMKTHFRKNGPPVEKREELKFIDALEVYRVFQNWTDQFEVDEAVFEDVLVPFTPKRKNKNGDVEQSGMSKQACLRLGEGFGIIEGAAAAAGLYKPVNLRTVTPSVWKRKLGVTSEKKTSLELARELWPQFAERRFARKMDDGRAEAALIGYYGHVTQFSR